MMVDIYYYADSRGKYIQQYFLSLSSLNLEKEILYNMHTLKGHRSSFLSEKKHILEKW